jgi:hypothetical protein
MWVSWRPKQSVAITERTDGIHWNPSEVVIGPKPETGWEDDIKRPIVVHRRDGYHMWYTGQWSLAHWLCHRPGYGAVASPPALEPPDPNQPALPRRRLGSQLWRSRMARRCARPRDALVLPDFQRPRPAWIHNQCRTPRIDVAPRICSGRAFGMHVAFKCGNLTGAAVATRLHGARHQTINGRNTACAPRDLN